MRTDCDEEQKAHSSIYEEQRRKLSISFTGKTRVIKDQFERFAREHAAAPTPPRHKIWKVKVFARSPQALLVSNHSAFDVAQYQDRPRSAAMSMIHILAIPTARTHPIQNAVCLSPDNVHILDDMIQLFRSAWADPEVRRAILLHQRQSIQQRGQIRPDPDARDAALLHLSELEAELHSVGFDDFQFGLHLVPDHTVDHLHLHVVLGPYRFRRYSTSAHDEKTKDAYELRDYVLGHVKHAPLFSDAVYDVEEEQLVNPCHVEEL